MVLWRVARRPLIDLDGRGGELAGSRWHSRGRPVVWCATSASLAVLEILVHHDLPFALLPDDYVLVRLETDGDPACGVVRPGELADGWRGPRGERHCRPIGDAWLRARAVAVLLVPSVVLPHEQDALLNPRHRDAERFRVADVAPLG